LEKGVREVPADVERERLRHFIGLRHQPHISHAPEVHHRLHMLNHRVDRASMGPLKWDPVARTTKFLKPFGMKPSQNQGSNQTVEIPPAIVPQSFRTKGWDDIKLTRADICVKMYHEHGKEFNNKKKCTGFMNKECKNPTPASQDMCDHWAKLNKIVETGKSEEEINLAINQEIQMHAHSGGPAPAPAMASSPGAAIEYLKRMNADEPLPSQGFNGELVEHDNMLTATEDWHKEYGPHPTYEAICAQYPDNSWCRLRGYHGKQEIREEPERLESNNGWLLPFMLVCICLVLAAFGMNG